MAISFVEIKNPYTECIFIRSTYLSILTEIGQKTVEGEAFDTQQTKKIAIDNLSDLGDVKIVTYRQIHVGGQLTNILVHLVFD
jgi:hypothetical protein